MPPQRMLVWGCSGHARVLLDVLHFHGHQVEAFVDQDVQESLLDGVPVLPADTDWVAWQSERRRTAAPEVLGVVAIGRQGGHRKKIQALWNSIGIRLPTLIHPMASVSPCAFVGEGSQVLAMAVVASGAQVAEVCIINHRASVDHDCVVSSGVMVGPGATVCGNVHIGEDAFIGAGSTILPRLRIGAGAMIGAGSVVTRDIPPGATVAGNPARVLTHRAQSA